MKPAGQPSGDQQPASIEFVPKHELDLAQQEIDRLRKENDRLQQETERLRRELEAALRARPRRIRAAHQKPTPSGQAVSHIGQSELGEGGAKWCAVSIAGVCQYDAYGNLLLHRLADLLERNLRLGLKLNPFRDPSPLAPLRILAPYLR